MEFQCPHACVQPQSHTPSGLSGSHFSGPHVPPSRVHTHSELLVIRAGFPFSSDEPGVHGSGYKAVQGGIHGPLERYSSFMPNCLQQEDVVVWESEGARGSQVQVSHAGFWA